MKYPDRNATKIVFLPITTKIDEADASTTYVGEAEIKTQTSTAEWRIKKISVSGNVTTISWADGDSNFNNIWDDRATLTYL